MTWKITGKEAGSLGLLDQYSSAAAAYSLRSLSVGYKGSVVRVRRDNDNAEQDFTATEVSDGTLAAWVGAGNDGFVRTWYDQSGNGRHAEQSTQNRQPFIVSSGSLILENSLPTLNFNGHSLNLPSYFATVDDSSFSIFSACLTQKGNYGTFLNIINGATRILSKAGFVLGYGGSGGSGSQLTSDISSFSLVSIFQSNGTAFTNSVQTATSAVKAGDILGTARNSIGVDNFSSYWLGVFSEMIIYPSNQSSNRAAIEDNINTYYSIF